MIFSKQKLKNTKQSGFLLVELVVALFIFSIVAVVSLGSVITVFDANKKAQSLQSVMNNLNLAMDSMTKALAVGKNFDCGSSGGDCVGSGDNEITFTSQFGETITYEFLSTCPPAFGGGGGCITRRVDDGVNSPPTVRFTAKEIEIQNVVFSVYGTEPLYPVLTDTTQPRVSIFIKGLAKAGPRNNTEFTLQTTVSQRSPDLF